MAGQLANVYKAADELQKIRETANSYDEWLELTELAHPGFLTPTCELPPPVHETERFYNYFRSGRWEYMWRVREWYANGKKL